MQGGKRIDQISGAQREVEENEENLSCQETKKLQMKERRKNGDAISSLSFRTFFYSGFIHSSRRAKTVYRTVKRCN